MAMGRALRTMALGLLATAGAASAGAYYLLQRPVPRGRGRVRLRGLEAEVEVLRDRWGVPHIYASNLRDLFFAVGYAQAQDRFVAALGVFYAISQAFGGKTALKSFHKSISPQKQGMVVGDSAGMAELRRRIDMAVASGAMA